MTARHDFPEALRALMYGHTARRSSWPVAWSVMQVNGVRVTLCRAPPLRSPLDRELDDVNTPINVREIAYPSHFAMETATSFLPWTPSNDDMFADDWEVR